MNDPLAHKPLTREERDAWRSEYLCGPIRASGISRTIMRLLDDLDQKDAEIARIFRENTANLDAMCADLEVCKVLSEALLATHRRLEAERDAARADLEREAAARHHADEQRKIAGDMYDAAVKERDDARRHVEIGASYCKKLEAERDAARAALIKVRQGLEHWHKARDETLERLKAVAEAAVAVVKNIATVPYGLILDEDTAVCLDVALRAAGYLKDEK